MILSTGSVAYYKKRMIVIRYQPYCTLRVFRMSVVGTNQKVQISELTTPICMNIICENENRNDT